MPAQGPVYATPPDLGVIFVTKRIRAKYKISRRLGVSLWGRGKDPYNDKNYGPGLHGAAGSRKKKSDFGIQLQAKQKLKGYYGNINERQFRKIYQEAARRRGDTGENLIGLLEQRLDAVIYRSNFTPTVFSARQLVSHKHVTVNGQTVNIPSYRVKEGDVVQVKEKSRQIPMVMQAVQTQERPVPEYLEVNTKEFSAKFLVAPKLADVPFPVEMQPHLVVEFYSR